MKMDLLTAVGALVLISCLHTGTAATSTTDARKVGKFAHICFTFHLFSIRKPFSSHRRICIQQYEKCDPISKTQRSSTSAKGNVRTMVFVLSCCPVCLSFLSFTQNSLLFYFPLVIFNMY